MILRKIIIPLIVAISLNNILIAQKTGGQFTLKGEITGHDYNYVYLTYNGASGKYTKDSSAIKSGHFEFKGTIDGPVVASLNGKTQTRSVGDPNYTNFFLEPVTMTVTVEDKKFKSAKYTGSAIEHEYEILLRSKTLVEEKYKVQLDSLRTVKDHEKNAEVRERLAPYFAEMDMQDYLFFDKHPKSYVTAYMMRFHTGELTLDSLQLFYDRLGVALQQSSYGKDIDAEIKKLKSGSPGSMAKDFSSTDINGNKLSLSDYKGKYVLLDFWASWCVPCRKGNPHMKDLYAKYKNKGAGIEFIGVSDDDRAEDKWKEAVAKDAIGIWKHVRRGLKFENGQYDRSGDISESFGIHTLPTRILIDTKGMIIGRYGEQEEELNKKLIEIFGE